jgi:hypothetical protein
VRTSRLRNRPRLFHGLWLGGIVAQVIALGLPAHSTEEPVTHGLGLAMWIVAFLFRPAHSPRTKVDSPAGLRWYQNPDNF